MFFLSRKGSGWRWRMLSQVLGEGDGNKSDIHGVNKMEVRAQEGAFLETLARL
jgi:hypothetical protein